jgi:BirA family biotin operon repressor/biotin-[acetyl-CoA-carboxylase] ligase
VLDAREVEARTGWRVVALGAVASTNDEVLSRRRGDAPERLAVVAERQTAGRGRGGARFESPEGGLYASLLLRVARDDVPGPLVAAVATSLAEAVEAAAGVAAAVKWPNDVLVRGRKVAGVLAETLDAGARAPAVDVVVGVGVNVRAVPEALDPSVAAATTALSVEAGRPVRREDLLAAFLPALDARLRSLADREGRARLEADWRARLVLLGERVRFLVGDAPERGVLRDVSLARGLLVERPEGGASWRAAAHVRDLRRDAGDTLVTRPPEPRGDPVTREDDPPAASDSPRPPRETPE